MDADPCSDEFGLEMSSIREKRVGLRLARALAG